MDSTLYQCKTCSAFKPVVYFLHYQCEWRGSKNCPSTATICIQVLRTYGNELTRLLFKVEAVRKVSSGNKYTHQMINFKSEIKGKVSQGFDDISKSQKRFTINRNLITMLQFYDKLPPQCTKIGDECFWPQMDRKEWIAT